MQHYLTYYKLIELIKDNLPIKMKSFGHGDIVYFGERNENTLYPLMFVTPLQFTYDENTTQVNLSIIFGDIVNTDLSNQVDVVSDMSLAARDFLSQISNPIGVFYSQFDVVVPVISNTFVERFNDHIGGVALDINIVYFEDINACDQYVSPSPSPTPSTTPSITPSLTPTPTPSTTPIIQSMIVGGSYTTLNGITRNRLLKLNSNGTEDTSFYTNLGTGFNQSVGSVIIQPDGKILVGGFFGQFNGNTRLYLVRLNSNGTEDVSFYTNLGTSFNGIVNWVSLQSDGKIVVNGGFNLLNGNIRTRIVRLNSDGTEDTAFYTNLGSSFAGTVIQTTIQPDGKILVVGGFNVFNANTRNRLVRLNSDGTEDTAFYANLGTAFSAQTNVTLVQPDGKILVGGTFTSFNGNTRNRLVRLNSDGTEDTAFYANLGTGFVTNITDLAIQSDGKILVGGTFTTLNGNTRNRIVRLNSDGTEDTAFYANLGTAFNFPTADFKIQLDGKILIAGNFTTLNGITRNRLIRLNNDGTEDTAFYANLGTGFNPQPNIIALV